MKTIKGWTLLTEPSELEGWRAQNPPVETRFEPAAYPCLVRLRKEGQAWVEEEALTAADLRELLELQESLGTLVAQHAPAGATHRGSRCPSCYWSLYDGVRCQNPDCRLTGQNIWRSERLRLSNQEAAVLILAAPHGNGHGEPVSPVSEALPALPGSRAMEAFRAERQRQVEAEGVAFGLDLTPTGAANSPRPDSAT